MELCIESANNLLYGWYIFRRFNEFWMVCVWSFGPFGRRSFFEKGSRNHFIKRSFFHWSGQVCGLNLIFWYAKSNTQIFSQLKCFAFHKSEQNLTFQHETYFISISWFLFIISISINLETLKMEHSSINKIIICCTWSILRQLNIRAVYPIQLC